LYFKDADVSKFQWIIDPFSTNVSIPTTCEQEQVMSISCDGSLKDTFDADKFPQLSLLAKTDYLSLSDKAIKALLPFVITYLWNTGFSFVSVMEIKYRLWSISEKELRVTSVSMTHTIRKLCAEQQAHAAH
jgi:hypothetical protein